MLLSTAGKARHDASLVLLEACNLGARTYRFSAQRRAERLLEVRAVHDHGSAPEPLLHHSGWHLVEYLPFGERSSPFECRGFRPPAPSRTGQAFVEPSSRWPTARCPPRSRAARPPSRRPRPPSLPAAALSPLRPHRFPANDDGPHGERRTSRAGWTCA